MKSWNGLWFCKQMMITGFKECVPMESYRLQLSADLMKQIEAWGAVRGLSLDEAVQVLLVKAFWGVF